MADCECGKIVANGVLCADCWARMENSKGQKHLWKKEYVDHDISDCERCARCGCTTNQDYPEYCITESERNWEQCRKKKQN